MAAGSPPFAAHLVASLQRETLNAPQKGDLVTRSGNDPSWARTTRLTIEKVRIGRFSLGFAG